MVLTPTQGLTHWQHPSFFAYFPQACTFEGILAELYQTSVTNPGFNVRTPGAAIPHIINYHLVDI